MSRGPDSSKALNQLRARSGRVDSAWEVPHSSGIAPSTLMCAADIDFA